MWRLLRAVDPAAMDPVDEFDEAMDDALGHLIDPVPDAAAYFDVYPNSDAAHVATMRRLFEEFVSMAAGHDESLPEARVEALLAELRWLWRDLRCIELADERLARTELGGDHPLGTDDRERVREMAGGVASGARCPSGGGRAYRRVDGAERDGCS
jgi:hypothetical protein